MTLTSKAEQYIPGPFMLLYSSVQNKNSHPDLQGVFYALGNNHRLILFQLLCYNEYEVNDLIILTNANYDAIRKQLNILEAYRLIVSYKDSKERLYHANPLAVRDLQLWAATIDAVVAKFN